MTSGRGTRKSRMGPPTDLNHRSNEVKKLKKKKKKSHLAETDRSGPPHHKAAENHSEVEANRVAERVAELVVVAE